MESKESVYDFPRELDEKRKKQLCGKMTGILIDDRCSVGQAIEVLEAAKEHILKYVMVAGKDEYTDDFKKGLGAHN